MRQNDGFQSCSGDTSPLRYFLEILVLFYRPQEKENPLKCGWILVGDTEMNRREENRTISRQASEAILGTPGRFTLYPPLSFPIGSILRPN
jgi:hypothetical protein